MIDPKSLTENDIKFLNDYEGYLGFRKTLVLKWLLYCKSRVICLYTGNQYGKTETAMMNYYYRAHGTHPITHRNFRSDMKVRTVRLASENLPGDNEETEVKNTIYPVLKRRFNPSWIKRDITARRPIVTIANHITGPKPFQFEFVSYGQTVQSGAGTQRLSVYADESLPYEFFEEQLPRLLAADGDFIQTLTPVPGLLGWEFDYFYERAKYIYRTKAVIDRIYQRTGEKLPYLQTTDSKEDISVIMAATDDNPIYDDLAKLRSEREGKIITPSEYIDDMFSAYDDEDVIDARRYGIFRQLSGKVYKTFNTKTHVIDGSKYFSGGLPYEYKHFRGIDYHQKNPWAFVWIMVSPMDEVFVVRDGSFSPGKVTTYDIASEISVMSGEYGFRLDLIDPLANQTQVNTNTTTVDDLNRYFRAFKAQGEGSGGYWQPWDTKGTRGREEVTKRLINSAKVGRPFNNEVTENGRKVFLPTIWYFDRCSVTIESMKNWRYEKWESRNSEMRNDEKETVQQKWSHHPISIECLLKSPIVSSARFTGNSENHRTPAYYRGRR
jgi:hypothetical protein